VILYLFYFSSSYFTAFGSEVVVVILQWRIVMRIAQIAPPWISVPPKNYGGTEAVIAHLIEEQVRSGHEVTMYAPEDTRTSARLISFIPHPLLEEGRPWHAPLKAYYHLVKAIEHIQEQAYDVVHAHLSSPADMYLYPLLSSLSTPHVVTLHSPFPFDQCDDWQGDADSFFMDWSPSVPLVAISESARKQALQQLPQLNFAGVVPNGLSTDDYTPIGHHRENFLVWLGRFSPEKGPHHAIEAARRSGIPLMLGGTIDHTSKETQDYFHQTIEPQIDNQHIRYLGAVNMEQKQRLLSRARGFLNPIEWEEPFGMVMIEAMAVGCPVITFRHGAAPEVVHHEVSGFVVNTLDEMIEMIPHLDSLDQTDIRAHVEEHFSVRAMARRYETIYRYVIAQSKIPSFSSPGS
jgi:glycosyltransferase involved in cell wall biosynthesis